MRQTNTETDAIHILPLRIVPLRTAGLRRARLVKNARMEGMVELFTNANSGSGQIVPARLPQFFDFTPEELNDTKVISQLSLLPSYDVYSLRLEFRRLGIPVSSKNDLCLSSDKSRGLTRHMNVFVEPLLAHIYGDGRFDNKGYGGLIALFSNPDLGKTRQNLSKLAKSLDIKFSELPEFFERYSDVYLSLAYYASLLQEIEPPVDSLIDTIDKILIDNRLQHSTSLSANCRQLKERLVNTTVNLAYILDTFKDQTENMWNNITPDRFRKMEKLILDYQRVAGANLCALVVKSNAWHQLKPKSDLRACAHFIMSDIFAGMSEMPPMEALLVANSDNGASADSQLDDAWAI